MQVYKLDTNDQPFPYIKLVYITKEDYEVDRRMLTFNGEYLGEYAKTFTEAKKMLIKYIKGRKAHWEDQMKWARSLKKAEVDKRT